MSQCVAVVEGALVLSTASPCTSLVLLDASEYSALSFSGFIPPSPEQAAQAFGWGYSGVLICYLAAWGCAQILKNIDRD